MHYNRKKQQIVLDNPKLVLCENGDFKIKADLVEQYEIIDMHCHIFNGLSQLFPPILQKEKSNNRKSLMDELAKMRRIIAKLLPDAPHETLLTLDTSMGMNMISQAKEFSETSGVTGVVLTKLDGTGKGGCAVRIQSEFQLPVLFAGFGEQPEDLQEFNPDSYASAMFGMEEQ